MIRSFTAIAALLITGAGMSGTSLAAQPKSGAAPVAIASLSEGQNALAPALRKGILRPELTLTRDLIAFGDLISGLPAQAAAIPAFRAPALGETGTIQVARIVEAAKAAGVITEASDLVGQGFAQVVVTRAARRIVAADVESAVRTGLQERFGVDARGFALAIDGGAPIIAVEPELNGDVAVVDLTYDARSRRIQARVAVPGSMALRLKPVRVTGLLVETVEVVVPRRAIARGETLSPVDLSIERRPRDGLGAELIADLRAATDKVARRALPAGLPLRSADVQREEIVGKGDLVTIVYETPGLMITMRGKAGEAGAMGDVITVTNPQSKRVLQGTVSGPGRITVQASSAGRVARAP